MTALEKHIQQWMHNRSFLSTISLKYPDWIVTVAFYVALHAVDSLLTHDKVERITNHEARNDVITRTNKYSKIKSKYLPLYDLSRTVRYLADPSSWVRPEDLEKYVIREFLSPIEKSVQNLMSRDLKLPAITLGGDSASSTTTAVPTSPPREIH